MRLVVNIPDSTGLERIGEQSAEFDPFNVAIAKPNLELSMEMAGLGSGNLLLIVIERFLDWNALEVQLESANEGSIGWSGIDGQL